MKRLIYILKLFSTTIFDKHFYLNFFFNNHFENLLFLENYFFFKIYSKNISFKNNNFDNFFSYFLYTQF